MHAFRLSLPTFIMGITTLYHKLEVCLVYLSVLCACLSLPVCLPLLSPLSVHDGVLLETSRCCSALARALLVITGGVLSHIGSTLQQTPEMLEEVSGCTPEEVGMIHVLTDYFCLATTQRGRTGEENRGRINETIKNHAVFFFFLVVVLLFLCSVEIWGRECTVYQACLCFPFTGGEVVGVQAPPPSCLSQLNDDRVFP